ncbi:hypothetical protein K439DRAFT_1081223 [Ramaria rubella]|nr:hypothetical protein K439DRAFT_1081223 [Ramaria rubella]
MVDPTEVMSWHSNFNVPQTTMSAPAVSLETEARTAPAEQGKHPIIDPASGHAREVLMPSEVASPTRTNSQPQQASTQPGDGGKSRVEDPDSFGNRVPWKNQVLGYAKVTRGKVFGKHDTEEMGNKILQGEVVPQETRKTLN